MIKSNLLSNLFTTGKLLCTFGESSPDYRLRVLSLQNTLPNKKKRKVCKEGGLIQKTTFTIWVDNPFVLGGSATIEAYDNSSLEETCFKFSSYNPDGQFVEAKEVWINDPSQVWRREIPLSINDLWNPPLFTIGQQIFLLGFSLPTGSKTKGVHASYVYSRTITGINPISMSILITRMRSPNAHALIERIDDSPENKYERAQNLHWLKIHSGKDERLELVSVVSIMDPRDPLHQTVLSNKSYNEWIGSVRSHASVESLPLATKDIEVSNPWKNRLKMMTPWKKI